MSALMYGVPVGDGMIQLQLAVSEDAVVVLVLREQYEALRQQAERDKAAVERAILVREQLRKRFRDCPEDQVLLIAAICNDLADALRTTEADR